MSYDKAEIYDQKYFFETPSSIAKTLADKIGEYLSCYEDRDVQVLDACSGAGQLSSELINAIGSKIKRISLIENNPTLLDRSKEKLDSCDVKRFYFCESIFSPESAHEIKNADIVVCNPPYRGYRKCTKEEIDQINQFNVGKNVDLAVAFVMHLVCQSKLGALIALVIRRDMIYGKAYKRFMEDLQARVSIEFISTNLGRVYSRSGSTESALLICRKVESNLRRDDSFGTFDYPKEWIEIDQVAYVKAGPNTGNDKFYLNRGDDFVIKPQSSKGFDCLWSSTRIENIIWKPDDFSNRRNISFQGKAGVVYRIAGAKFVCSILPEGINFLSRSPAILPRDKAYLDLITGISLSESWKSYVRNKVLTTNFTPSAIGGCKVPTLDSGLGQSVAALGAKARLIVEKRMKGQGASDLVNELNRNLFDANEVIASELKINSSFNELYLEA